MSDSVVTCMQLSKPQPLQLTRHVIQLDLELRKLSELRNKVCTELHDIEVTGACESVLQLTRQYAAAWAVYWSQPVVAGLRTRKPLEFHWTPLFEEERGDILESSTCVWFELAMTYAVCGQLFYSLGVEQLESFHDSSKHDHLKLAALYFQNGAFMFVEAEHCISQRWITEVRDSDPLIRDADATQIWTKLCLAAAQHCYISRLRQTLSEAKSKAKSSGSQELLKKREVLSKLWMAEASLYGQVLTLMKGMSMERHLKQLHREVGELYIESLTRAYHCLLSSIPSSKKNICSKEAAWLYVRSTLSKLLPGFSQKILERKLHKVQLERSDCYYLKLNEKESVPRSMRPTVRLEVSALAP